MRTISITIDEELLRAIDQTTRQTRRTRSEVFRAAVKDWLARARWREMARRDQEGYTTRPITADEFGDLIAAQPWLQNPPRTQGSAAVDSRRDLDVRVSHT